jgi:hypothetical protein
MLAGDRLAPRVLELGDPVGELGNEQNHKYQKIPNRLEDQPIGTRPSLTRQST